MQYLTILLVYWNAYYDFPIFDQSILLRNLILLLTYGSRAISMRDKFTIHNIDVTQKLHVHIILLRELSRCICHQTQTYIYIYIYGICTAKDYEMHFGLLLDYPQWFWNLTFYFLTFHIIYSLPPNNSTIIKVLYFTMILFNKIQQLLPLFYLIFFFLCFLFCDYILITINDWN